MITVRGPGRCIECSFHVATQGHRDGCGGTVPVAPDPDPEWEKLGFVERLAHRAVDDPTVYAQSSATLKREAARIRAQRDGTRASERSTASTLAQPGTNPRYVAAAIRAELDCLAAAGEGCRNDTLHRVACALFGLVKGGHADRGATHAELVRIATAIGLGHNEIHTTLRSAWGRVGPRDVPAPNRGAA